jgi:hypothetical protein
MKPTQKKGSAITQWIVNIFIGALFAVLIMSFLPVAK